MSTPVHDRRRVLLGAAAASWLVARGAAQAMNASWTAPEEDPTQAVISQDTWQKFTADGKPRAFAGNTVICPLPPQSKMRDAIGSRPKQEFQYTGDFCVQCGNATLLPMGIKLLCHTCGDVSVPR